MAQHCAMNSTPSSLCQLGRSVYIRYVFHVMGTAMRTRHWTKVHTEDRAEQHDTAPGDCSPQLQQAHPEVAGSSGHCT